MFSLNSSFLVPLQRWYRAKLCTDKSLFIEPMRRWFQRTHNRESAAPDSVGAQGSVASMQHPYDHNASTEAPLPKTRQYQTEAETGAPMDHPDSEVIQDVFGHREPQVDETDPPGPKPDATSPTTSDPPPAERIVLAADMLEPQPNATSQTIVEAVSSGGLAENGSARTHRSPMSRLDSMAPTASQPLVRTMVETLPQIQSGPGGLVTKDSSETLQDIFGKRVLSNPHVKSLLQQYDRSDIRELVVELRNFAKSIGALEGKG